MIAVFLLAGVASAEPVVIVSNGVARVPIVAGSVGKPVAELRHYLYRMSGAELKTEAARQGMTGVHVGLARDFPWVRFDGLEELGREGFLIQTNGDNVFLVANEPVGVQHAVIAFLHSLGCRWFFPGKAWEHIPEQTTIAGMWNLRHVPSFKIQRRIWYGFGAYPECARDLEDWVRHNHAMGQDDGLAIGHSWHGLDPKADFASHPEWFALTDGVRKAKKPCYTHPDVIRRAIEHALKQAARGAGMITMTPPDGLGYCECERCLAVCRGGKPYREHGTMFARRPDGVLVNVTSETLFQFVNEVAAAVAKSYPKTLVGCYAYSAYSHPPSFPLHPNVFLQTTTAFRRTSMSLPEQLAAFQKLGVKSGIRTYYSVYQWDWDYPGVTKGDLALPQLVEDLRFYHQRGVESINGESCCNWGPRGLGYYIAARLMWDIQADPKALIAEFYDKAFGPAALPMERYYVRWLGPYVAVRTAGGGNSKPEREAADKVEDELGAVAGKKANLTKAALKGAYRDLDEAAQLVKDVPTYRARVDHLRMYAHYLLLRLQLQEAGESKDAERIRRAVEAETVFGARIMNTGMIHARPLIGKEFYRRFLPYKAALEGTEEWPRSDAEVVEKALGKGFRRVRGDVPSHGEVETFWREDMAALGLR